MERNGWWFGMWRLGLCGLWLLAATGCEPASGNESELLTAVQEHIDRCLVDHCATASDPLCGYPALQTVSLFEQAHESIPANELNDVLGSECPCLIEKMKMHLEGKADDPCPVYFPWCRIVKNEAKGHRIQFQAFGPDRAVFDVFIDDIRLERIAQWGRNYQRLQIEGSGTTTQVGLPALPVVSVLVGLPAGVESVRLVSVDAGERETFEDLLPYPYQPLQREDATAIALQMDQAAYQSDEPYPPLDCELDPLGTWRNYRAQRVRVHPVRYFAKDHRLEVARRMRVELAFTYAAAAPPTARAPALGPVLHSYIAAFDNAADMDWAFSAAQVDKPDRVRYLVIAPDGLADAVTGLLEHRNSLGMKTALVRLGDLPDAGGLSGNTLAERIKTELGNWYQTDAIEYVLLVGDETQLPMYNFFPEEDEGLYSDYWYACLDGQDWYPEVALGRLPGRTPQDIHRQVAKILEYDRGDPNTLWRQNILMVAHQEKTPRDYASVSEQIRWATYVGLPSFATLYGHLGATSEQIVEAVNQGVGLVNYRGHGTPDSWPGWNGTDFRVDEHKWANRGRTPVVFSVACLTAALQEAEPTLAEQLVQLPDGGAVAFLGATQPSSTVVNHEFDRQLFRAFLNENIRQIGAVSNYATTAVLNTFGDDPVALMNAVMYLWLGDPALTLDAGRPASQDYPIDWCGMPLSGQVQVTAGLEEPVSVQVWVDGLTDPAGQAPYLSVELGSGPRGTSPDSPDWTWSKAVFEKDAGGYDQYVGMLTGTTAGDELVFAFRVSGDRGASHTTCDTDGSLNGWSTGSLGQAVVLPRKAMRIENAVLLEPWNLSLATYEDSPLLMAELTIQPDSFDERLVPFIRAEFGVGPIGSQPDDTNWFWMEPPLIDHQDNLLAFGLRIAFGDPNHVSFTFRFSTDDGQSWIIADRDGSANGSSADLLGNLLVGFSQP